MRSYDDVFSECIASGVSAADGLGDIAWMIFLLWAVVRVTIAVLDLRAERRAIQEARTMENCIRALYTREFGEKRDVRVND